MAERLFVLDTEMTQLADKIREKTNSTDPLSFPQGFIDAIDNAAGGLNFEVVGGTTQPSNPKENTIWVNTNVEIPMWGCGAASERTYTTQGAVWLEIANASDIKMNISEDNTIFIYPKIATQYISNTWVEKDVKIYQNGQWNSLVNILNILKNGTIHSKAGSYVAVGSTSCNGTIYSTSYNTSSGNSGYFSNLIDVTPYKTLRFHINPTGYYDSGLLGLGLMPRVIKASETVNTAINQLTAGKRLYSTGTQWVNIDISSLTGSYYINIISVAKFTIDEIVLTSEVVT